MKTNNGKIGLIISVACAWSFAVSAQITPDNFRQYISDKKIISKVGLMHPADVKEFYIRLNYQTAWIKEENENNLDILLHVLKISPGFGLREKDYQYSYIDSFRRGGIRFQDRYDSLEAEVRFTDAAINFYRDIAYGSVKPALRYNGLNYSPDCRSIPGLLADYVSKDLLQLLISDLSPSIPEIKALEKKIRWINTVTTSSTFKEVIIISTKISETNEPLIVKLHQLGIIDTVNKFLPDSLLKQHVKEAQRQFNLSVDGKLGSSTLRMLNIPLSERIQQLTLSVNYYRWLYCLTQTQSVIVVNIPASYLKVYQKNEVILEMRMIVGQKSTPTFTLTSTVNEIILYPYWHVPKSIIIKELLPEIREDPGFLDAGNYQVLDKDGNIVDPGSVNWKALSKNYFPYVIRQSTGCDNSLGLLKLNFNNPFGAFLHDTPTKPLFQLNNRFFSHGCMRMEKPMELGRLLLKNNRIAIDTVEEKGCLLNQSSVTIRADETMPLVVWYNPVSTDSTGRVIFYTDVYERFDWKKKE